MKKRKFGILDWICNILWAACFILFLKLCVTAVEFPALVLPSVRQNLLYSIEKSSGYEREVAIEKYRTNYCDKGIFLWNGRVSKEIFFEHWGIEDSNERSIIARALNGNFTNLQSLNDRLIKNESLNGILAELESLLD